MRIYQAGQLLLAVAGATSVSNIHPWPAVGDGGVRLSALERTCQGRAFAQRRDAAVIAALKASGLRAGELAGIRYDPHDASRSDLDLCQHEITVRGKGGGSRIVRIGHEAAQALDRYIRIRSKHAQAWRPQQQIAHLLMLPGLASGYMDRERHAEWERRAGERAPSRRYARLSSAYVPVG